MTKSLAKNPSTVYILMSTFNGAKFLSDQLLSIEHQTFKNWRLLISDDGSEDRTLSIAKLFQKKWGEDRLIIINGPHQGFCKNFLSMACNPSIEADFYAFSDQDDVWLPNKLEKALTTLNGIDDLTLPLAYGGRTRIVDEHLIPIGLSPAFMLPKSFRNALVQSIAGGNTIVFNQATKLLLEKSGVQEVVSHDWWVYQLVKGAGGLFCYDLEPYVLYRQHSNSLVGGSKSFKSKVDRVLYVINGRFKKWNDINYAALSKVKHLLTRENQDILEIYGKFRGANLKDRIRLLEVCGLYRQNLGGTFSLWLATLFNKI